QAHAWHLERGQGLLHVGVEVLGEPGLLGGGGKREQCGGDANADDAHHERAPSDRGRGTLEDNPDFGNRVTFALVTLTPSRSSRSSTDGRCQEAPVARTAPSRD